jgi:hypothetical protein
VAIFKLLQRVGNTLQVNPEQQSLALFLLAMVYRRQGKRAAFADCLGRLLERQRCHPETITVQAAAFAKQLLYQSLIFGC